MLFHQRRHLPTLNQLRDEFDRQFVGLLDKLDNLATAVPRYVESRHFPAVNVWEDADRVYAEAEVPGLKSGDLEITVVGNQLTVKGTRGGGAGEEATYHRRERGLGEFSRVVRLPVEIDSAGVEAHLRDGVLLITLPKRESAKPRKVSINAKT